MTHRDGFPRISARRVGRGDAGHREPRATLSESLGKPPPRSAMGPRRRASGSLDDPSSAAAALPLRRVDVPHRLRPASYPTDRMADPYGSLLPLLGISGDFTAYRENLQRGLDLAMDYANAQSVDGGIALEMESADDRGLPAEGVLIARRFCSDGAIDIVLS